MSDERIDLTRDEALDILAALETAAAQVTDLHTAFEIDGAIRILIPRLFPDLPKGE